MLTKLLRNEHGAVSLYLIVIVVPLFLLCALFVDYARLRAAEKETENAVKTGLRSTLSAFSSPLRDYGLFALKPEALEAGELFGKSVAGNLSGELDSASFRYIDSKLADRSAKFAGLDTLANHDVLKRQIVEEMKYRAPVTYALEITDKFRKNGMSRAMKQASGFGEHAEAVQKLLDERDEWLDEAWQEVVRLDTKAGTDHPYYVSALGQLDTLSGKIGTHQIDQVRSWISSGENQLAGLKSQIRSIDSSIAAIASAGQGGYEAIRSLVEAKDRLNEEVQEMTARLADWRQLLNDLLEYAKLLVALKTKSAADYAVLTGYVDSFNEAMAKARKANDELNAELDRIAAETSQSGAVAANSVFQSLYAMSRKQLDDYATRMGAAVSLFGGLKAQLEQVVFYTEAQYETTLAAVNEYKEMADALYEQQSAQETIRNRNKAEERKQLKEQRSKAQNALEQAVKAIGGCAAPGFSDPSKDAYEKLQGNAASGSGGFYQLFLELNRKPAAAEDASVELDNAERTGRSALKLLETIAEAAGEFRDRMYVDEFVLAKFNYRTFGIEKDASGGLKADRELSNRGSHALANQEAEYLLYGSGSCAGNYASAYAEMYAVRLAVGTMEALTEPHIEAMNIGSPLLVLVAAIAEGAIKAQLDMTKLLNGEAVALSHKIAPGFTLYYKDYLRLFLIVHGKERNVLARMQSLIQLNTGYDLRQHATYAQGSATVSVKMWFIPGMMKTLGMNRLAACTVNGNRCELAKTAFLAYE